MNPKFLSPLFALLIFVAHLNCVLEHRLGDARETGSSSATQLVDSSEGNSPFRTTMPSENEDCDHGCICQGATLVDHFVLTDFRSSELHFFIQSLLSLDHGTAQPLRESGGLFDHGFAPIPLRAMTCRALLQSFLI